MAWPGGSPDTVELALRPVDSRDTLEALSEPQAPPTPNIINLRGLCNFHGFCQSPVPPRRAAMLVQLLIMMYIATCLVFYVAHVIDYYLTVL